MDGSVAVVDKETRRAAKERRKLQHDQKIQQAEQILIEAGYKSSGRLCGRGMDIEFFLGYGPHVVIGICSVKGIYRVDVLVPLSSSSRTDDVLDALRKAVA
jgi:hypothetical protein